MQTFHKIILVALLLWSAGCAEPANTADVHVSTRRPPELLAELLRERLDRSPRKSAKHTVRIITAPAELSSQPEYRHGRKLPAVVVTEIAPGTFHVIDRSHSDEQALPPPPRWTLREFQVRANAYGELDLLADIVAAFVYLRLEERGQARRLLEALRASADALSIQHNAAVLSLLDTELDDRPRRVRFIETYARILAADPESPEAAYNLTRMLYESERYAEAAAVWQRYPRAFPQDPAAPEERRIAAAALRALLLLLNGRTNEAGDRLHQMIHDFPSTRYELRSPSRDRYAAKLDDLHRRIPEMIGTRCLQLARAHRAAGRNDDAEREYSTALIFHRDDPFVWSEAADLAYISAKDFPSAALARYDEVLQLVDGHHREGLPPAPLRRITATAYVRTAVARNAHPRSTIPRLERAVELDPTLAEAHYELGRQLYIYNRYESALHHHRRAVELEPRNKIYRNAAENPRLLDQASREKEERLDRY